MNSCLSVPVSLRWAGHLSRCPSPLPLWLLETDTSLWLERKKQVKKWMNDFLFVLSKPIMCIKFKPHFVFLYFAHTIGCFGLFKWSSATTVQGFWNTFLRMSANFSLTFGVEKCKMKLCHWLPSPELQHLDGSVSMELSSHGTGSKTF